MRVAKLAYSSLLRMFMTSFPSLITVAEYFGLAICELPSGLKISIVFLELKHFAHNRRSFTNYRFYHSKFAPPAV